MKSATGWNWLASLAFVFALLAFSDQVTLAAAPAAGGAVKVSAYAPAEDLDNQMDEYLKNLAKTVESAESFKDESGNLTKDANTMAVLALVIGLHDQESKYKAAAPALLKASQALAEVKDYEAAKKAAAGVIAALDSKESANLKWEKVASLPELMKQVPNVHTKLKMKITGTRLKSQAKATQGYTAAIAAIAQASIVDASPAKTPEDVQKWQTYCVDMRDAAAAVNAAIRKQDRATLDDTMTKLQKSCDDCHKAFHQEALSK
jgi:hypothetical protein